MVGIKKACVATFMKIRHFLVVWCRERKKAEDSENVFIKAPAKTFLLTRRCHAWPTFYQIDFMKR